MDEKNYFELKQFVPNISYDDFMKQKVTTPVQIENEIVVTLCIYIRDKRFNIRKKYLHLFD